MPAVPHFAFRPLAVDQGVAAGADVPGAEPRGWPALLDLAHWAPPIPQLQGSDLDEAEDGMEPEVDGNLAVVLQHLAGCRRREDIMDVLRPMDRPTYFAVVSAMTEYFENDLQLRLGDISVRDSAIPLLNRRMTAAGFVLFEVAIVRYFRRTFLNRGSSERSRARRSRGAGCRPSP